MPPLLFKIASCAQCHHSTLNPLTLDSLLSRSSYHNLIHYATYEFIVHFIIILY